MSEICLKNVKNILHCLRKFVQIGSEDVGDLHWIGSTSAVATVKTSKSEDFLDSEMTPTLACGCCRQLWVFSMFPFSGGKKRGEEESCYQEEGS